MANHIEALGQLNCLAVAEAARRVFAERGTHAFPPGVRHASRMGAEIGESGTRAGVRTHDSS